jgi:CheY-like chemotaxis protein
MQRALQSQAKLRRIVIVEDNLDQVHTLAMMLREMGHAVDFAINGYVAYDLVRRFRPDTAIIDLGLPGMTGFEVAAQIRKDPELHAVRLIAFTAYGDKQYQDRAMAVGFDDYHVKPVDPQLLYALFGDAKDFQAR